MEVKHRLEHDSEYMCLCSVMMLGSCYLHLGNVSWAAHTFKHKNNIHYSRNWQSFASAIVEHSHGNSHGSRMLDYKTKLKWISCRLVRSYFYWIINRMKFLYLKFVGVIDFIRVTSFQIHPLRKFREVGSTRKFNRIYLWFNFLT